MPCYSGSISTVFDAFLLAEVALRGFHPMATARLDPSELAIIEPGTVVVFDKTETGMTRWIDGKSWSPSRFKQGFFTYTELVNKRPTGLLKKAISVLAPNGHHIHIISYYNQHMPSSSLPALISNLPINPAQIYQEAEKYRYFKCFRSQSKGWRQPCSAPYPVKDPCTSPGNPSPSNAPRFLDCTLSLSDPYSSPTRLPSIANLTYLLQPTDPGKISHYSFDEDIRQLNRLSSQFSL